MRTLYVKAICLLTVVLVLNSCGEPTPAALKKYSAVPSKVMGLPGKAKQIAVTSCALVEETVYCWGNSRQDGTTPGKDYSTTAVPLKFDHVVEIAGAVDNFVFVLNQRGEIWYTEGHKPFGTHIEHLINETAGLPCVFMMGLGLTCELIVDSATAKTTSWVPITSPTGIVSVIGNPFHGGGGDGLFLLENGDVYCNGAEYCDYYFNNDRQSLESPDNDDPRMYGMPPMRAIGFGCAIGRDGLVYCWGSNQVGQRGIGNTVYFHGDWTPALNIKNAIRVAGSQFDHRCAIDGHHDLWCWGQNDVGQVGNGRINALGKPCIDDPIRGDFPQGHCAGVYAPVKIMSDVDDVTVLGGNSCALKTDGTVWCWGDQTNGQLGNGVDVH